MDEEGSPYWECPECGGIWFEAPVVFEKGVWVDEHTYEFEYPDQGIVNTVSAEVKCQRCGYKFNIKQHYGWWTRPANYSQKD